MSEFVQSIASGLLVLAGAGFFLTGAIGHIRMPDFFTRIHAASLSDTTGVALILVGLAVHAGFSLVTVKLAVLILFLLFMGPAVTHALAAAALAAGLRSSGTRATMSPAKPQKAPAHAKQRSRKGRR